MDLCIYFEETALAHSPSMRIPLDAAVNKTGDTWHVRLDNVPRGGGGGGGSGGGGLVRYGFMAGAYTRPLFGSTSAHLWDTLGA